MTSLDHLVNAVATLTKTTENNVVVTSHTDTMTSKNNNIEKKTEFSIQNIMHQDKTKIDDKKDENKDKKFIDSFIATLNNEGKEYLEKVSKKYSVETIHEILLLNRFSCLTNVSSTAVDKAALSRSFQEYMSYLAPSFNATKSFTSINDPDKKKSFGFSEHQIDGILQKKGGTVKPTTSFLQFCNQFSGSNTNSSVNKSFSSEIPQSATPKDPSQTQTKVIPPNVLKFFPIRSPADNNKSGTSQIPSFQTSVIVDQSSLNKPATDRSASFNFPIPVPQTSASRPNSFQGDISSITEKEAAKLQEMQKKLSSQDYDGDTMLHIAVAHENVKIAKSLINQMDREGLNIRNNHGQTALHIACYINLKDIVRDLIIHGTNVAIADDKGNTALHIACESGHEGAVEQMLQCYKKDPENYDKMFNMRNIEGVAAIHIATMKGSLNIIKNIVRYSNHLNIQELKCGQTALHMSLLHSKTDITELLLNAGVYVNIPNYTGIYPLSYAVQSKNVRLVECLLRCDADIGKSQELDKIDSTNKEIKKLLEKESRRRRKRRKKESDGDV